MKRRNFAFAIPAAVIAACSNGTTQPTVSLQTVATDIMLISTSLNTAFSSPQVQAAIKLPPAVTVALADLQSVAGAAANATDAASMQVTVQTVANDVNTIVSAASVLPGLPTNISTILTAAAVLLPVLEAAVGTVVQSVNPIVAPNVATMTPATARKSLSTGGN